MPSGRPADGSPEDVDGEAEEAVGGGGALDNGEVEAPQCGAVVDDAHVVHGVRDLAQKGVLVGQLSSGPPRCRSGDTGRRWRRKTRIGTNSGATWPNFGADNRAGLGTSNFDSGAARGARDTDGDPHSDFGPVFPTLLRNPQSSFLEDQCRATRVPPIRDDAPPRLLLPHPACPDPFRRISPSMHIRHACATKIRDTHPLKHKIASLRERAQKLETNRPDSATAPFTANLFGTPLSWAAQRLIAWRRTT